MPLPIPQQVLSQPVTAMYQGKALRQELAMNEKKMKLADLQIEALENPQPDPKEQRDEGKYQADAALAANTSSVWAYDNTEGTEEEKQAAAIEAGVRKIDEYLPGGYDAALEAYNSKFGGTYDINLARSQVAAEGGGQRRTLTSEEAMALPGMTQHRAENAVIQVDDSGQIFIDDAPTGLSAEDLTARGGVNASGVSKNTIDFQDNVVGAVGAVQMGTEMLIASATNPEALGVPGGFMRFGANLVSGAKAIADWAGYDKLSLDETEKQTMGSSAFDYSALDTDKLGVSGAEAEKFRAGVYGIAFAAAVAEQGTRPTDKDIQQFIDQIGGRATSAQSFRETIAQFMRRQDRRLKTIADVKQIGEVDREAAFKSWTPAFRSFMETYAKTSGRQTATNAETGQRFIEMTPGNWEEF